MPDEDLLASEWSLLSIAEGEDVEIDEEDVSYEILGNLGMGGHAYVQKVRDPFTGKCFARKTLRCSNKRDLGRAKQMLYDEVKNIRALAPHPHVIRVHATYIAGLEVAILLQPIADGGSLADFMASYRELSLSDWQRYHRKDILWRAFRCLTNALEYMHREGFRNKPVIRHKDIKPSNILVHEGRVIFTDFGISACYADGNTTTTGRPQFLSRLYCAPEVADHDSRNRKSDVFSLGCVFLEIFACLYPHVVTPDLIVISEPDRAPYHVRARAIQVALKKMIPDLMAKSSNMILTSILCNMLDPDPNTRPTAQVVQQELLEVHEMPTCHYCNVFDEVIARDLLFPSQHYNLLLNSMASYRIKTT